MQYSSTTNCTLQLSIKTFMKVGFIAGSCIILQLYVPFLNYQLSLYIYICNRNLSRFDEHDFQVDKIKAVLQYFSIVLP